MRGLDALGAEEARGLRGLVFDLDDTVLDRGALGEEAYGALFRLRDAGLLLVACTGRPCGWGELVQRMWPVDATMVENGAIAWVRERDAHGEARVSPIGTTPFAEHLARRHVLVSLAEELVARFPHAALADDNAARVSDVTIDIGEHRRVAADDVAAMRAIARDRGVRTFQSSVHMHLTFDAEDKATGTIGLLTTRFDEDATAARRRWAYAGDSANDAVAFAAFATTFGVQNVAAHLRGITVPPRYVAAEPMGRGFASIARRLIELRAGL